MCIMSETSKVQPHLELSYCKSINIWNNNGNEESLDIVEKLKKTDSLSDFNYFPCYCTHCIYIYYVYL